MPFLLIRQDITKMKVDAIVNAANASLMGGGGVDGAIHRAAGPGLLEECRTLGGCNTGEAKITGGYRLPAKHVIHTVGPIYRGGMSGEPILLASCYNNSLRLALENRCETVAFPLISAGVYGYPRAEAIRAAADAIRAFLDENDDCMTVYLVVYDRESMEEGRALFPDIASYIDDRYAAVHSDARDTFTARQRAANCLFRSKRDKLRDTASRPSYPDVPPTASRPDNRAAISFEETAAPDCQPEPPSAAPAAPLYAAPMLSLEERLAQADESFSEMLLR